MSGQHTGHKDRTIPTKEGPTASSTHIPSDEVNLTPPHMGQLGWAATLPKHRLQEDWGDRNASPSTTYRSGKA
jgi:hypothetical protein